MQHYLEYDALLVVILISTSLNRAYNTVFNGLVKGQRTRPRFFIREPLETRMVFDTGCT